MSRILAHLLCILRTLIVWHILEKDNGRETFPLEDATYSIASSVQGYTNSWSKVNALKRTFWPLWHSVGDNSFWSNGSMGYERQWPGWEVWYSGPPLGDRELSEKGREGLSEDSHRSLEALSVHNWKGLEEGFRWVIVKAPWLIWWKVGDWVHTDKKGLWRDVDCRAGWPPLSSPSGSNNTLKKNGDSEVRTASGSTNGYAWLSQWWVCSTLTLELLGPTALEGGTFPCIRLTSQGVPCPGRGHPLLLPHSPKPRKVKIDCCQDQKGGLESVFALFRVNQDREGKHRMLSDFQVFL